jgi:hypothetical protein
LSRDAPEADGMSRSVPLSLFFALLFSGATPMLRAQTTVVFQSGVSGGAYALTRSCAVRNNTALTNATVVESAVLEVGTTVTQASGHVLVDFPLVIGPAAGQIPPGATIVSAKLKLWCSAAGGGSGTARTITCRTMTDFDRQGAWFEPATDSPTTQSSSVGVSWLRRDGRPTALRTWAATTTTAPTFIDTTLGLLYPTFVSSINVVPNGAGGAFALNQFHEWNVKAAVEIWAQGFPAQGFKLETSGGPVTYASDDEANATLRPKLEVVYNAPAPGAPVFNRSPRTTGVLPASPAITQGSDLLLTLTAIDDDGTTPELVITNRPANGELVGVMPFLTYRPRPDFVGVDSFTFAARDAFSISYPETIAITVTPGPGVVSQVFQEGVAPGGSSTAGETRSCAIRWNATSHAAFEDVTFRLLKDSRAGFLDYPNLFGAGAGSIPLGSQILSARLELRANNINGLGVPRRLSAHRITDPLARGTTWFEPTTTQVDPTGGDFQGVSYVYPDARTAQTQTPPAWWTPGGDPHPYDVATSDVTAADVNGVWKAFDVTAAVAAWSSGAPNYGWTLRSDDVVNSTYFDADDAVDPATRPRLIVAYRPPGAALGMSEPPHAAAGPDQTVYSGQTVRLDGSLTTHPAAAPIFPVWIQTGGPPVVLQPAPHDPPGTPGAASLRPRFVAPTAPPGGTVALDFVLAAGAVGQFALDAVRITVKPPPAGGVISSPTVDAGPDVSLVELSFGGVTASVTGGVGPFLYRWTKVDGPPMALTGALTSTVTFQTPAVGPANARVLLDLEVTDLGVPGEISVVHDEIEIFVVNAPNAVPIANPGPTRTIAPGEWTVLDATASTDGDQHPLTYTWTFVGPASSPQDLSQYVPQGTAAAGKTPWRAPAVAAQTVFTFQLAAFDGADTGTATLAITVRPPPPSFAGNPVSLAPYRAELSAAEARHLLRRLGRGRHPEDVAAVVAQSQAPGQGLSAIVDAAFAVVPTPGVQDEAMNYAPPIVSPSAGIPAYNQPFDPYPSLTTSQIHAHWLTHAFRSPNALLERTVRVIHGHLAASVRNLPDGKRHWSLLHADMFRHGVFVPGTTNLEPGTSVFGNWRQILLFFARDPITLSFIDGFDNLRFAPNENFAREFFELHALGIFDENGVAIYGENDVKEAARAFTGWRPVCYVLDPTRPGSCEPSFSLPFHDSGTKVILGSAATNFDDAAVVDRALDYDGGDNAARRLAKVLLQAFVTATPSPALVGQTANVILANNWEMAPVLAAILKSEAMFSPAARKAVVKTPVDLALDAAKLLRTPLQTRDLFFGSSLYNHLRTLQHFLGDPIDVNGWPKDLEWADDFMSIRRSELVRRLVLFSRTPTAPVAAAPGVFPDYPGIAPNPTSLDAFLPPPFARRADETLRTLCEHFDVELKESAGAGGSTSEFQLAKTLLDTLPIGDAASCPTTAPFDGDCPAHKDRLWSVILLLLEHPEFSAL